jgi:AcrR family transcriptional regulator
MTTEPKPGGTKEAIMEATFQALCTHGYPETTIAKIADEFEKSQSLLYYHYDDKEDLFEDFLRYLLRQFEREIECIDSDKQAKRLETILDHLIPADTTNEQLLFRQALSEMRSQAPYNESYHEQFERMDTLILEEIIDAIETGIDAGTFRAVNSKQTGEFIYSTVYGAVERGSTLGDRNLLERNRKLVEEYIDTQLIDHRDQTTSA